MRAFQAFIAMTMIWLAAIVPAQGQSLIRDAEIEQILREWTDPVLEVAGLVPSDVGLYIINDPSINAFVAGGQRIHLHTGLIGFDVGTRMRRRATGVAQTPKTGHTKRRRYGRSHSRCLI